MGEANAFADEDWVPERGFLWEFELIISSDVGGFSPGGGDVCSAEHRVAPEEESRIPCLRNDITDFLKLH